MDVNEQIDRFVAKYRAGRPARYSGPEPPIRERPQPFHGAAAKPAPRPLATRPPDRTFKLPAKTPRDMARTAAGLRQVQSREWANHQLMNAPPTEKGLDETRRAVRGAKDQGEMSRKTLENVPGDAPQYTSPTSAPGPEPPKVDPPHPGMTTRERDHWISRTAEADPQYAQSVQGLNAIRQAFDGSPQAGENLYRVKEIVDQSWKEAKKAAERKYDRDLLTAGLKVNTPASPTETPGKSWGGSADAPGPSVMAGKPQPGHASPDDHKADLNRRVLEYHKFLDEVMPKLRSTRDMAEHRRLSDERDAMYEPLERDLKAFRRANPGVDLGVDQWVDKEALAKAYRGPAGDRRRQQILRGARYAANLLVERYGKVSAPRAPKPPSPDNCGTGAGGFGKGNTCSPGGSGVTAAPPVKKGPAVRTPSPPTPRPATPKASTPPSRRSDPLPRASTQEKPEAAPTPRKATATGFVSPEVDSGLDFEEARRRSTSEHQQKWVRLSHDIDRSLGLDGTTRTVIGDWAPEGESAGAEPSTMTTYRGVKDFDTLKYALAIKGRVAKQWAVIPFLADRKGKDSLWELDVPGDARSVREVLDRHGLAFRTIEEGDGRTKVHVFDPGSGLGDTVLSVARHFKVNPGVRRGTGEFFPAGTGNREESFGKYEEYIDGYESANPGRKRWVPPAGQGSDGGRGGLWDWDWRSRYARRAQVERYAKGLRRVVRLVSRYAANPCGDGGPAKKGFHKGNTCQAGGEGTATLTRTPAKKAATPDAGAGARLPGRASTLPRELSGMVSARRVGKGAEARVVLAGGRPAPSHIKPALVPPDWTDVRVNVDPGSDVLVKARDKAGRVKTVYSDAHHMRQAAAKFARVRELVSQWDDVLGEIARDRKSPDPATREAADAMFLIAHQATRPGSDSDTKARVKAYGATTLRGEHVVDSPEGVRLKFVGKEGVAHDHLVRDPELAAMLARRRETSASRGGRLFDTNDKRLLAYANRLDGGKFTPKDFRTARGTMLAVGEIAKEQSPPKTKAEYKARVKAVAEKVSGVLGNRPAQALESYIDPNVFAAWRID